MLTGIHILLTYECTFECDHCFLHCGPFAKGTFTLEKLKALFTEIDKIPAIEWIYLEGGEPFLYYPLMIEGIRMAKRRGLMAGVVSNAYWATSVDDAELWLKPLADLGIDDLSLSSDDFHQGEDSDHSPQWALDAAKKLGMSSDTICIEGPIMKPVAVEKGQRGEPIIGGDVRFRGRAIEKLAEGLPTRPWKELTCCPDEDLENPGRVHVDAYGNVHLCQGLSMGNMWQTPLSSLIKNYDARKHPICGPLIKGGPARLAEEYSVKIQAVGLSRDEYIDECHFCYLVRKNLIDRFPEILAPRQVYGLE